MTDINPNQAKALADKKARLEQERLRLRAILAQVEEALADIDAFERVSKALMFQDNAPAQPSRTKFGIRDAIRSVIDFNVKMETSAIFAKVLELRPDVSQASVGPELSRMTKAGELVSNGRGVYEKVFLPNS